MGAMQSVGGDMILVAAIALCSASALERLSLEGRARGEMPALATISCARRLETRLNSDARKPVMLRDFDSRSHCMSTPSSTP